MSAPEWRSLDTPLRLITAEGAGDYSVYADRTGKRVYLEHETSRVLVAVQDMEGTDLDLDRRQVMDALGLTYFFQWIEDLRARVIDPDLVDEVRQCEDCNCADWADEMFWTGYETQVCDNCFLSYSGCDDCDESFRNVIRVAGGRVVCGGCRDGHYFFCDYCDDYIHEESEHYHEDDDDCDCESPEQTFYVRNDGEAPLANDTRVTVSLPAGIISEVGLRAIRSYLYNQSYAMTDQDQKDRFLAACYQIEQLGEKWQTKDGNYAKRLSRFFYKLNGTKVTPDIMSQVGNIAREHSTAVDFDIEVTRNLNLPREEFAHDGSCWWTEYSESRCALKTNGGFGLRSFSKPSEWSPGYVTGRVWVMPLKMDDNGDLWPTFETMTPSAFIVFNGYEALAGYPGARVMAHMAGMTYRKIGFTCSPMYVNSESGYLIAPEAIASRHTDGAISFTLDQHSHLYTSERKVLAHV